MAATIATGRLAAIAATALFAAVYGYGSRTEIEDGKFNARTRALHLFAGRDSQFGIRDGGRENAEASQGYSMDFTFLPGMAAQPFSLKTLNGTISFPSALFYNSTILIHAYDQNSAFCVCLWTSDDSLDAVVRNSTSRTHYVFITKAPDSYSAYKQSVWMQTRLLSRIKAERAAADDLISRLHFVTTPYYALGNWIPAVLKQWTCQDHNCGLSQIVVENYEVSPIPVYAPRLDARYDWLPNPETSGPSTSYQAVYVDDACSEVSSSVKGLAVIVPANDSCSYFQMVRNLQNAGAVTAIVVASVDEPIVDMNCIGDECSMPLSIPASMIANPGWIFQSGVQYAVTYQTSPSDNFFFAINPSGSLAEVGWLLYPSFQFLVWQAQWFDYELTLAQRLSAPATVVQVFNYSAMTGANGTSASVSIPVPSKLKSYNRLELDLSLSCPGTRDQDCYHWDRVVQLFVCCSPQSPICGAELGRWITPFRRRIGRWLTDVTSLMNLLDSSTCTFTMQATSWEVWYPTLNLRFIPAEAGKQALAATSIDSLFYPGATFDSTYNLHWKPYQYVLPAETTKVLITAIITGHGSDENGCGEFCVTTHYIVVNGNYHNVTFADAGSPLGCADHVLDGVLPNEHGTWLYGRDGWCDGQMVKPWVVDVTDDVLRGRRSSALLTGQIEYFGFFNGASPNPKQSPGIMVVYSYVTAYS